eukprot:6407908-Ditylum_brightwellii.AAC.1
MATCYYKEKGNLLAYKAADQDLSTFKTYFTMQRFNHQPHPRPFEDRFWSVYRKNILDCKEGQKRQKGLRGSFIKLKEIADNKDCWTIFVICMWSNLIKIRGRLSEIATVAKSHIKAK